MHNDAFMLRARTRSGMANAMACAIGLLLLGAQACQKDQTLDVNLSPVASAGEDLELDFAGEPLTVKLDGSKSKDPDGKVVKYRWRSATALPDGGVGPYEGQDGELDPKDVRKPELQLGQGNYTFTLWVTDDDGAVSEPDSVALRIGTDAVAECVGKVFDMVPESCRQCVCEISAECQQAAVACDGNCWGLLMCIGANCPDATDAACIIENCADFVGGDAPMQARAVGTPCVAPCRDDCGSGS